MTPDTRTQELRPVEGRTVLRRVLHLLGAPKGEKTGAESPSLPDDLREGPEALGRDFVQVLLHTMGGDRNGRSVLKFARRHPDTYIDSLAELVRRLTGESVGVLDRNVVLSWPASEAVAVWEPLPRMEQSGSASNGF